MPKPESRGGVEGEVREQWAVEDHERRKTKIRPLLERCAAYGEPPCTGNDRDTWGESKFLTAKDWKQASATSGHWSENWPIGNLVYTRQWLVCWADAAECLRLTEMVGWLCSLKPKFVKPPDGMEFLRERISEVHEYFLRLVVEGDGVFDDLVDDVARLRRRCEPSVEEMWTTGYLGGRWELAKYFRWIIEMLDSSQPDGRLFVTLNRLATLLGVSPDALRKRITRGRVKLPPPSHRQAAGAKRIQAGWELDQILQLQLTAQQVESLRRDPGYTA